MCRSRFWIRDSHACRNPAHSYTQGPDDVPRPLGISPGRLQVDSDERDRIVSILLSIALCRRPGAEVAQQVFEIPRMDHLKLRRREFVKGKRQTSIPILDDAALGRPVGPHDVGIIAVNDRVDLGRDVVQLITPNRDDATGL